MSYITFLVLFFTFFAFLCKVSSAARRYIKFIIFVGLGDILTSVPIPLMLLRPRDTRNSKLLGLALRLNGKVLGLTTKVEGHENIVRDSGCVIVANHQSLLDILVMAEIWMAMGNTISVSKVENLIIQPFATAFWLSGTLFINRRKKEGARAALNQTSDFIRKKKGRILIFPEGTRRSSEKLLPFKKGAFYLALDAKCPIQPVAVSKYSFLGENRFDTGTLRVKILPPISTEGLSVDNINELMEKTYNIMSENVAQMSREERVMNHEGIEIKSNNKEE